MTAAQRRPELKDEKVKSMRKWVQVSVLRLRLDGGRGVPLGTEQIWLSGMGNNAFASLGHKMRICFSDFPACLWFACCHTLPRLSWSLSLHMPFCADILTETVGNCLMVVLETLSSGSIRSRLRSCWGFSPEMLLALRFSSLGHVTQAFLFLSFVGLEMQPG